MNLFINRDHTEKPRINTGQLNEVIARLAAADFPGRTEHQIEAQGAVLVLENRLLKEEVPYYLHYRRARLTRFTQTSRLPLTA